MPGSPQLETVRPQEGSRAPRSRRGGLLFTDENLGLLARVLDDWFRVPGTSIRFGLNGLVGLAPALGDILAGLASCIFLLAAWVRGVPYVTLVRMLVNLGLDVILGSIPLLGDAFDIAWKANRRNYALLTKRLERPRPQTWRDWIFLCLIAAAILAIFMAPLLLLLWALEWLRLHF